MQTISPISNPDEIRQARDATEPPAPGEQATANTLVSGQQLTQGITEQPASPQQQAPAQVTGEQPVAEQTPNPANPFAADYQMPAVTRNTNSIYPDPDKIKADRVASGATTFTPVDSAVYTYDKPFGVMLISVVAGTVAGLYVYLLFVTGFSRFSSWLQAVLVALCAVVSVGLWRRNYVIYWLAVALAAVLAAWHGYRFVDQFIGIDWGILTAIAGSGFGRLVVGGLILQLVFVIVPAYITYYLLRPQVARAFGGDK